MERINDRQVHRREVAAIAPTGPQACEMNFFAVLIFAQIYAASRNAARLVARKERTSAAETITSACFGAAAGYRATRKNSVLNSC
jgi:hypothetical protein